jgi:hypothetical protein
MVLGYLAIHDTFGGFVVTHVPTGLALTRHLQEPIARQLVEELQRFDWDFRDYDHFLTPRRRVTKVGTEIKKIVTDYRQQQAANNWRFQS